MTRLVLIVLLVVLSSKPVLAEWILNGNDATSGAKVYFDKDTTVREGTRATMWTVWDHAEPQGPYNHLSVLKLDEYDCLGQRSRHLATIYVSGHMGEGTVLHRDEPPAGVKSKLDELFYGWSVLLPRTNGAFLLQSACNSLSK